MDRITPLSAVELDDLWERALAAFHEASRKLGTRSVSCEIGAIPFDLIYAGPTLSQAFRPALQGIESGDGQSPLAKIMVFDCAESGVSAPTIGRPIQNLIRWRGDCWQATDAKRHVYFLYADYTLQLFDRSAGICIVIIDSLKRLPAWAFAAPLRIPLALILRKHGVFFVHGAAVGTADGAVLITGYGGSGKSTTALSCYRAGLPLLGDDYVAIKMPSCSGQMPSVHNIYSSLKIVHHEIDAEKFSQSSEGKALLFPFGANPELLTRSAPLCAVFSAYRTGNSATHICPVDPEEVARIAFASTALQIPGDDEDVANAISDCARSAGGAFQLALGVDRSGVAIAIADFLVSPLPTPVPSPQPIWEMSGALKRISVIIPVHNTAHLIAEALNSIEAQQYPDIEVIVVDDGSTDALDSALASSGFPVRLIRQIRRGPAAARNAGIAASTGEWLAFLDADDLWGPGALMRLVRDLTLHPRAGVVHGKAISFLADEDTGEYVNAMHPRENFQFFIGAGIYRRNAFDLVGGFSESLTFCEDVEWYARAFDLVQVVEIPDLVLHVRTHAGNMTANTAAENFGRFQAMKSLFEHRRKLAATEASKSPTQIEFLELK